MPHLIVENWQGKIFVAVDFGEETIDDRRRNPRPKRIPITADDAILPIATLRRIFKTEIDNAFQTNAEKLLAEATDKTERLKKTLEGIIKTSNQDGEVQSAKAAWKRITGKDYA
jgi:histone H3/H4